MIWVEFLLAAILAVLIFLAWIVPLLIGAISRQIEALAAMLAKLGESGDDRADLLRQIVDRTERIPKPPERRLPEYPGDPLGKWPTE